MSWFWGLVAAVVLVTIGLVFFFEVLKPLYQLRGALRRLADGDFRPLILRTRSGIFRRSARHIRQIGEQLQVLDRQIADEGFSLRAILSSMVEGVIIVDRVQRIRLANDSFRRIFAPHLSPINRMLIEVLRDHEVDGCVRSLLEKGGSCRMEISTESANGAGASGVGASSKPEHFEVFAGALQPRASSSPVGAVIVFHNVTAIRELESVRREFVANVSHEFRTPLSIISGYIETLLDGGMEDSDLARHALRVMYRNSQRINLLLEDLLTLARLEQRTQQLDLQPMDYLKTLKDVVARLEPLISENAAAVEIFTEGGSFAAPGDSRRIQQVFTNLLENALHYGPQGKTVVRITATSGADELEFLFSDNGPGIPPEDQKHIFERFYRVDKHRSRDAGGSGLGLSIVKHIVIAHAGSVGILDSSADGTTFRVAIPLEQMTSAPAPAAT